MATPSRNLMPIQQFAFERTKAQQSAKRTAGIAKLASVAKEPQKAKPAPTAPIRTAPAPKPKPRTSTRQGDRLKSRLASKFESGNAIQKRRGAVRVCVK